MTKLNILAISGSTRKKSSNINLIKAIADLTSETFNVTLYDGLTKIPHFNPDLDNDNPPLAVVNFRRQINDADGILICTPEYAMGVPGTLKNAIDWTVSSMEFSKKPLALITAASSGEKAHGSLLATLLVIEARIAPETQLLISYVKTKVNEQCKITDPATLNEVIKLTASLNKIITNDEITLLLPPTVN